MNYYYCFPVAYPQRGGDGEILCTSISPKDKHNTGPTERPQEFWGWDSVDVRSFTVRFLRCCQTLWRDHLYQRLTELSSLRSQGTDLEFLASMI